MTTNSTVQLSVISTDQLFSTEKSEPSLEALYLTQYYRNNPKAMNIIPILICADNTPTLPLPTVAIKHRYQVLSNHHIFSARQKAQCPFALCLHLDKPEQNRNLWQAELQSESEREQVKFNISTMDSDDFRQVFRYLSKKSSSKLFTCTELIQAVAEHPGRPYWSSWEPTKAIAKSLKVTMTKRHTDYLENYFLFESQSLPSLCINTVSAEELRRHLHILSLREEVIDQLSHQISDSSSRRYWRDFKDMVNALGLENQPATSNILQAKTKEVKTILAKLAQGFHFSPTPPPIPNTLVFLLERMKKEELRYEAKRRGLTYNKSMKKRELVDLLSSSS